MKTRTVGSIKTLSLPQNRDNKRQKKIWISPDGSRRCYSIPQALKYAAKSGQQVLSAKTSSDDNGSKPSKQSNLSLNLRHRKLSAQEVVEKLTEGEKRGLPEGWTIVWDNIADQRVWISPDGKKKCKGIPQALAYSVKIGLIAADKVPREHWMRRNTMRVLSEEEVKQFLTEARQKGLPNGWNVECKCCFLPSSTTTSLYHIIIASDIFLSASVMELPYSYVSPSYVLYFS